MSESNTIVNYIKQGNVTKLKTETGNVLGSKIMSMIKDRRTEISNQMFNSGNKMNSVNDK